MPDPILITYATRSGSTKGVAEAIAQSFIASGIPVRVLPMHEVTHLAEYKAVIAGSAIQDKKWLPEAMQFMENNKTILNSKPVALFLVCITMSMNQAEKYRPEVARWHDPVKTFVTPVSEALFAGQLFLDRIPSFKVRILYRISILLGFFKQGDHRDWQAIQSWVTTLKSVLPIV